MSGHRRSRGWALLTAGVVVATVVGAGCTSSAKAPQVSVQSTSQSALPSGITVSGVGKIYGKPDTMTFDLAVSLKRASVSEASSANAATTQAVINAMKAKGVSEDKIQTSNYLIQPEYTYSNGKQHPDGFTVSNSVTAKLAVKDDPGGVIDAAVAAGGNDVMVQGVAFSLEDDSNQLTLARAVAWANARKKAQQFADLSGRKLGPVDAIGEEVAQQPNTFNVASARYAAAADQAATPTPIQAGQVGTSVTIDARFTFK